MTGIARQRADAGAVQLDVVEELRSTVGDSDGQFIGALVGLYRVESARRLREMRTAVQVGDEASLQFAAHSLRGSTLTLGGSSLSELCAQLERARPAQVDVAAVVAEASERVDTLLGELTNYLAERSIVETVGEDV